MRLAFRLPHGAKHRKDALLHPVDTSSVVVMNGYVGLVPAFIQERVKATVRQSRRPAPFEPLNALTAWERRIRVLALRKPALTHPETGELFYLKA